jgi:hypothetical protein
MKRNYLILIICIGFSVGCTGDGGVGPKIPQAMKVENVCNIPKSGAEKFGAYRNLGGGRWEKWTDNATLNYGCKGSKTSVDIQNTEAGTISVDYDSVGTQNEVAYIGIDYDAFGDSSAIPNEIDRRKEFYEFLNFISEATFAKSISESAKNKITDDKSFSPIGQKDNPQVEDLGAGYIEISRNMENNTVVIKVALYPNEFAFRTYKGK